MGGVYERLQYLILRELRGVWGNPPPGNFKKIGNLRQHFVHFEDSLLGNKAGKSEGHKVECIIEINLEPHNVVQNIPNKPTNDGLSTQRTILNANSRSTEIPFPSRCIFFHTVSRLPPPPPPSLRAYDRSQSFSNTLLKQTYKVLFDEAILPLQLIVGQPKNVVHPKWRPNLWLK